MKFRHVSGAITPSIDWRKDMEYKVVSLMNKEVFLETLHITKKFGDIAAVNDVSMQVWLGEIQGLIGENGSGKSTITSMLSGIYSITSGEVRIEGKLYKPEDPLEARNSGIQMIVQETGTVNNLTVAENIFLGNEGIFQKHGVVDARRMNEEAKKALDRVGLSHVDPSSPINQHIFETRKMIEVARALYYDPMLFIVDETTTALSHDGRILLHGIMKKLREQGKAVLFISHDLTELMEICDTLTVLRDGQLVSTITKSDFDEKTIKQAMVGRELAGNLYREDYDPSSQETVSLEIDGLCYGTLIDISLKIHEGEIVGIGGLSGSGMHELGKLMFGMYKPQSGEVRIYGRKITGISEAIENRIGYVSKDRDNETLILEASIRNNLVLSALAQIKKSFLLFPRAEKEFAQKQIDRLNIKCSSMNQLVGELSGGNKQKVSFGKWIGNNSKTLILDGPTRGVDIGVKTTMYQLMYELKKSGYTIVIISEELQELIGMCDRIVMLKNGRISGELPRSRSLSEAQMIDYII